MSNIEEIPIEKVKSREINTVHAYFQRDLALRYYGKYGKEITKEDLNDCLYDWVMHNNHKFSAGYRRVLVEHPEILVLYQSDPVPALEQMEYWLYKNDYGGNQEHAEAA